MALLLFLPAPLVHKYLTPVMTGIFFKCDGSVSRVKLPRSFKQTVGFYKKKAVSSNEVDVTDLKILKENEYLTCLYDCGAFEAQAPDNFHFEGNRCLGDILVFKTRGSPSDVYEDMVCQDTLDIEFIKSTIKDFSKNLCAYLHDKGFKRLYEASGKNVQLFPHIIEMISGGVSTTLYNGHCAVGYCPTGSVVRFEIDLLTKTEKKRSLTPVVCSYYFSEVKKEMEEMLAEMSGRVR